MTSRIPSDGAKSVVQPEYSRWYDNAPFVVRTPPLWADHDWFQNIYDFASEWSLSGNHAPHRIVFSPIYELPFGQGKRFNLSGVADTILGGWHISGIYTFQSGSPFGVTVQNGAPRRQGRQRRRRHALRQPRRRSGSPQPRSARSGWPPGRALDE